MKEICGEKYVTSSKVIPMVHCLVDKLNSANPITIMGLDLKDHLISETEKRFNLNRPARRCT